MRPIEELPPYEVVIGYWPERHFKLGFVVRYPDVPWLSDDLRIMEVINHEEPHCRLDPEDHPTHWTWLPAELKPDALEAS